MVTSDKARTKAVHLVGIAGTGMGAFAGLLKQAGYEVRGSDMNVYPPMSDKLRDWGIEVRTPYAPENLDPAADLVVIGNVIRRDNVEATAVRERGLTQASFPETLGRLFLEDRHSVVVAGTHGKTTTTTLLAHTLLSAGRDPGFLVGGIPSARASDKEQSPSGPAEDASARGLEESFRVGAPGGPFVVEGDEYDTAYFDKGPKFLHYHPRSLLVTSLELDHVDIYDSLEQIAARFREVAALVPAKGHLVYCADDPRLTEAMASSGTNARVESYGERGHWRADDVHEDEQGVRFRVVHEGHDRGEVRVPLSGRHGVLNALGAYAVLSRLRLKHAEIAAGFASFGGVKRRMEVVGTADDVVVVDDFAHHPTAVQLTLEGARRRYAGRPLWALFEPRSATSCRKIFQDDYARAFDAADRVLLAPPGRQLDPTEALDVTRLAADVGARGVPARACETIDEMIDVARQEAKAGAVLLCMSNGAFGGIHKRLLEALGARSL